MIYTPAKAQWVCTQTEWWTHRLWREGDRLLYDADPSIPKLLPEPDFEKARKPNGEIDWALIWFRAERSSYFPIAIVLTAKGRVRYGEGDIQAIRPGRNARGIGRERIVEIHGPHPIQEITEEECLLEGVTFTAGLEFPWGIIAHPPGGWLAAQRAFGIGIWNGIYRDEQGKQWADNPPVWGLRIQRMGKEWHAPPSA